MFLNRLEFAMDIINYAAIWCVYAHNSPISK